MKVSELIKELQKLNPEGDMDVYYPSNDDVDFRGIRGVYEDTVWVEDEHGEWDAQVIVFR